MRGRKENGLNLSSGSYDTHKKKNRTEKKKPRGGQGQSQASSDTGRRAFISSSSVSGQCGLIRGEGVCSASGSAHGGKTGRGEGRVGGRERRRTG